MRAYTDSFNISLGISSYLLCLPEKKWEQGDLSFGLSQLWGGAKLHCEEYFCTRNVSMNPSCLWSGTFLQYNQLLSYFTNIWDSLPRQLFFEVENRHRHNVLFLLVSPFPHCHKSIVIRLSLQLWLWPLSFLDSKNISQYLRLLQTTGFDKSTLKPLMLQNSDHWKIKRHPWMNPWTIWHWKRTTQSISFVNKVTKRLVKFCPSHFTFSLDPSLACDLHMAQTAILLGKFWLCKN